MSEDPDDRANDPKDDPDMGDSLPNVVPIFPLPGVLLLPRGTLPLNIFEPRYLAMVKDALGGNRVIGMVQPRDPEDRGFEPPVYATGCLGRITDHRDMADGRIIIALQGISRFEILEEIDRTTPYRLVKVSYQRYALDRAAPEQIPARLRDEFLDVLREYFQYRSLSADWNAIDQAADDLLVNSLAMGCPFEPNEKQALLEAVTLTARTQTMKTIMEFSLANSHLFANDDGDDEPPLVIN